MALLEIRNLTKTFPPDTTAVDHVSLAVQDGDIVCLLGPSGCGKTTLLRLVAGLEFADNGAVWFDGRDVAQTPPHLRDFGMMFQDFALFPHKNVFDNVAFGLQMHAMPTAEISERVEEMLALVDLVGYGERDIAQLSGGEQQRVALARALAPGPRMLMLDEPLGALDRALRERLMLDLRAILKQVGVTALYVTHDQTEAFAISDRIAVMNEGRIEQYDTPQVVYGRPATPFVARFLGLFNLLPATAVGAKVVETALGRLRLGAPLPATDAEFLLLVRPDAATPVEPASNNRPNCFQAVVEAVSFRGKVYQVWVESDGGRLMFELGQAPAETGATVWLQLDPDKLMPLAATPVSQFASPF